MRHTIIVEGKEKAVNLTPLKAIRLRCIDCSGFSEKEVRECHITGCPLWPYRMGHNPERKGIGGDIKKNLRNKKLSNSTRG